MLIQDVTTGRLHEIPDHLYGSYLGEYGQYYEPSASGYSQGYGNPPQYADAQVVYDGLGNPVGFLPILAKLLPLAAQVLPSVLPAIGKIIPGLSSLLPGSSSAPPEQPAAPPAAAPPAMPAAPPPPQFPPQPMAPVMPEAYPTLPPQSMVPTAPMMQMVPRPGLPFGPQAVPYDPGFVPYPMVPPRRRHRRVHLLRRGTPAPVMPAPIRALDGPAPDQPVQAWGYPGGFNGYHRW
jgi:hypothetical protein